MNRIAAFLMAAALVSPAFAEQAKAPAPTAKTQTTQKPGARKRMAHQKAKKAKTPAQSSVSSLRREDPDYPWKLPS